MIPPRTFRARCKKTNSEALAERLGYSGLGESSDNETPTIDGKIVFA